jgi:hypothetical protein
VKSSVNKKGLREIKKVGSRKTKKERTRESRDAEEILQMIGKEVKRSDILIKNHKKRGTSQRPVSKNTRKKKQGSVNPKRKFEKLVLKKEKSSERPLVKVKKKKTKKIDPKDYATEMPKKLEEVQGAKKTSQGGRLLTKYSNTASEWHYKPREKVGPTQMKSALESKTPANKKSQKSKKKLKTKKVCKNKPIKAKRLSMAPGFKFSSQLNLNERKKNSKNNIYGHKNKISLDLMSANILSHKNIQIMERNVEKEEQDCPVKETSFEQEEPKPLNKMQNKKNLNLMVHGSLKDILDNSKRRDLLSREESKTSIQKLKVKVPTPNRINNPFVPTLNELVKTNPESEYSTQYNKVKDVYNMYQYSKISENSEENGAGLHSKELPGFNTIKTLDSSQKEKALPILEKSLRRLKKIEKKKFGYVSRESSSHRFSRRDNSSKFSDKIVENREQGEVKESKRMNNLQNKLGYSWTDKNSNFSSNVKNSVSIEGLSKSKMINKEDIMKYIAENYENLKGDLSLLIQNQEKSAPR